MKRNDQVRSKNKEGSFQCEGTVLSVQDGKVFLRSLSRLPSGWNPDKTWSVDFPDWKSKPVVSVRWHRKCRTATLKEWIASAAHKGISAEEAKSTYEQDCPITNMTLNPFDDLEIINEYKE